MKTKATNKCGCTTGNYTYIGLLRFLWGILYKGYIRLSNGQMAPYTVLVAVDLLTFFDRFSIGGSKRSACDWQRVGIR